MQDRRLTWGLAVLCVAAGVYAACGSSGANDVIPSDADGGAGDGSTSSSDAGTKSDGGASSPDGGSGNDSGSTTNQDGATPGPRDGGIFSDAAASVTGDGGAADDGGPGGNVSTLACGATTCSLATDFCCVYDNMNAPPNFLFSCASGNGCPALSAGKDPTALGCAAAANCPASTVCCIRDDGSRIWSECATTCASTNGVTAAQLCDPNAAQTGCPTSDPCSNNSIGDWKLPDGFATCGGVGN